MRLNNLRAVRLRKALTQQELSARSGVNRVTIARLETGADDDPFPRTIRKLADALGVSPDELSDGANEPHSVSPGREPPY